MEIIKIDNIQIWPAPITLKFPKIIRIHKILPKHDSKIRGMDFFND